MLREPALVWVRTLALVGHAARGERVGDLETALLAAKAGRAAKKAVDAAFASA
jgi:hypothetical protein